MNTPRSSRFLDMVALAALEHMRFTTRHHIEGAYSGRHQSRQQGGVGEFVDFREYSGSDPVSDELKQASQSPRPQMAPSSDVLIVLERLDTLEGYDRQHRKRYDLVDVRDLLNA